MTALARLGFDRERLVFAGRTALGACVALALAWALGLAHPQWAAMSVWAASQPLRGQLLEKSFFRLAGTVTGTLAGIALVLAGTVHPALLVAGLALWVALCTGIGNLQRGLVAYGTVLAGYTAAMVSLLEVGHPENVWALGLDRFLTVFTGVAVATLVGVAFAPRGGGQGLRTSVARLVAAVLEHLAEAGGGDSGALLLRIAAAEEGLDPHAAGSLRSRREIRATRAVLIAALALPLNRAAGAALAPGQAAALRDAAGLLRAGDAAGAGRALRAAGGADDLGEACGDLGAALVAWQDAAGTAAVPHPPVILHRDWIGAREAALRAGLALLLVGGIWQLTGWSSGNFMLLGLSVMISLFSSFESPVSFMRWVVLGQILGVAGMLACRWLVWPLAGSEGALIAMMMPFIVLGSLLVAHRRSARVSFDYNMVLLLLLQPHWPLEGSVGQSLTLGAGVLMAPVAAWVLYSTVFPANLHRRIDTLTRMMRDDLAALARDGEALAHRPVWRARLYHRTLRLLRLSESFGRARGEALESALEMLRAGHAIMQLHARLAAPGLSESDRRAFTWALRRIAASERDPDATRHALSRTEARLARCEPCAHGPA